MIPFLLVESYGEEIADRGSVDDLKRKLVAINDKIESLDTDISKQKATIKENESKVEALKNDLKEIKKTSSTSWAAIEKINDVEKDLLESQRELTASKNRLESLFVEKSDNLKLIDNLENDIDDLIISLRKQVDETEKIQPDSTKIGFDFAGYVKKIGITLSASCIEMIKNDIPTTCPTYKELADNLDSSDQNISGKFGFKDGFYQRLEPDMENSWRWYEFDNNLRIFVDPPVGMESRIKMIEIRPNFDTFTVNGEQIQSQKYEYEDIEFITPYSNKTETKAFKVETQKSGRTLYHDRFIDDYCKVAMLNSDTWLDTFPDTLHHMRQNCDEGTTHLDIVEFIPFMTREFLMTDSPSWKALQWFETAKIECKELCLSR